MNETNERPYDLVVVGGGIAGMVAAVRAAELGLSALVCEQGADERYLCNSRFTGGAFHLCFRSLAEAPDTLEAAIREVTRGSARTDLARAVAGDARAAVRWLGGQGVRFIKAGPQGWRHHFLSPPAMMQTGLNWEGRGGDVMLRTLRRRLEQLSGRVLLGMRARRLLMRQDRCIGLVVERDGLPETIRARHVAICDGGFQADHALLREFVSPAPDRLVQRGAATGRGDGLRMAREVGAALVGMDRFYGHLLCRQAMDSQRLWPYPIVDVIATSGIVVDGAGRRFVDEGMGGVHVTNAVARLDDPMSACAIFDLRIWNGPATEFILPPNPNLVLAGGQVLRADSIGALAERIGVDASALGRTVAEYNRALVGNELGTLDPPRSGQAARPLPIDAAPFMAVRLAAGITYTMGGIAIDADARVLRPDGTPVQGLYASGCATGGLEGGEASGYVGGLTKSTVTSLRLAAHVSRSQLASESGVPVSA